MTIRLNLTPLQARTLVHCALNGWGDGDMAEYFNRSEAEACHRALVKLCDAVGFDHPTNPDPARCMDSKSS